MPETVPSPHSKGPLKSARLFLGVTVLNALLAFPVLYATYKHFSTEQTPMDVGTYMAMAEGGPEAVGAPFRYRALTPLLVRAMDFLPGYGIEVDFTGNTAPPGSQKIFFHFLLLNFALTVLTSGLLFLYLRGPVGNGFAWAGSLLYLFAFSIPTANFIPMPDAACHLAIMAAVLLFERRETWAFLLACPIFILGVFTKEAFLVVMVPWILVHAAGDRRRLFYLLWALLAAAAYFALTLAMPVAAEQGSGAAGNLRRLFDPEWYFGSETYAGVRGARDLLRIFDPGTYSRTFLFHTVLSQLPLLAALAAWAWLRLARGVRVPFGRGLALFPALLWLGVVMGINNNAVRLAFMVFPAVALFQARVLEASFSREIEGPGKISRVPYCTQQDARLFGSLGQNRLDSEKSPGYDYGMIPQAVNLFEYADFRKFLEDYQAKRQAADPSFTRARLCKDLGLPNTRSYFNDIVKGSKPLSKTYMDRFVRALRMDGEEELYFRVLVDYNQSTSGPDRELYMDQLIALNRTPQKFVDADKYEFYKRWYHTAVFSLLDIHDVGGNFQDLAKRVYPPITPAQAQESIALLARLELIRRNERGVWKATAKTLNAGRYVRSELVKQYQLQCLDLAKKNMLMENDPKGTENFSTVTLSISREACVLIEKKLQKFKKEVRAIAHKDDVPADRVYQLNIQYFPQSSLEKAG